MDRRFLTILAAVVVIFVGIFIFSQHSNDKSPSSTVSSSSQPSNHVEGKGAKGVTLIEYGDYECPICGIYYSPLKQAQTQLDNDIYFQFRNLPLVQIHQNAFAAARAAEAAGFQNKYWQMHDKLYENQTQWQSAGNPLTLFSSYAQQIGLNVDQFKQDYASSRANGAINADLGAFDKTHQQHATPTFFLDGQYVDNSKFTDPQTGTPSVDKIVQVIQSEIAKKNPSASQ